MYCGEHREHGKLDYRQEYRLIFTLSDVEFDDAPFYPVVTDAMYLYIHLVTNTPRACYSN